MGMSFGSSVGSVLTVVAGGVDVRSTGTSGGLQHPEPQAIADIED